MFELVEVSVEWASLITGGAFVVCVFAFSKWLDDI